MSGRKDYVEPKEPGTPQENTKSTDLDLWGLTETQVPTRELPWN